jgi:hypothetical protein
MLSVSRICHAIADAKDLITRIESSTHEDDLTIQRNTAAFSSLVNEMQSIYISRCSWSDDAPEMWHYKSIFPSSSTILGSEPAYSMHIYHDLWIAN